MDQHLRPRRRDRRAAVGSAEQVGLAPRRRADGGAKRAQRGHDLPSEEAPAARNQNPDHSIPREAEPASPRLVSGVLNR